MGTLASTQTTHAWYIMHYYYSLTTDKDSSTLCDDDGFRLHHALVYGITPAGFLFLLCIALTIVICVLVCIISLKKDTHTLNLIHHIVKNADPDIQIHPERLTSLKTQLSSVDEVQPVPSGTRAQKDLQPAGDGRVDAAGSSGAPSPEQKLRNRGSPLSQQQSPTDQPQAAATPPQRNLSVAGVNHEITAASNSGTSSRYQRTGSGGVDQPDTGPLTPLLTQQQSVVSSKSRSAHKDNPVYYLVKKSMKDAKFPERKYKRLKEELRSTCEKCKKEQ
jgi:hypothetical protein